ncbi:MAG: hypothetical protein VST72_04985 [Nitrospirota bacterium]|nr:hypothetical protein [Nitrospirota bacterium]
MLKYKGGHKAGKGTYWNFNTGERIEITTEGMLPGDANTAYYRLPAAGILVLGPILGLLYAAFLPFIGIAMLMKIVTQKVAGGALNSVTPSVSFGWRPSEAYLAGKKKDLTPSKQDEAEKTGKSPGKD